MIFPSSEWIAGWVARSNGDEQFRTAGRGWDGAVGAVILPRAAGISIPLYLRLEGRDGQWTHHDFGSDPALVDATRFVITADYTVWKSVIRQELDPIRGLILGRLRVRGQLSSVLRWANAFRVMTQLAGGIDTTFLDEETE